MVACLYDLQTLWWSDSAGPARMRPMASQPSSATASKRRRRVLAIDDEPAMTEWLKMVIEAEGYEVRTALIGTRGEEIFKQWRPDVVVTDLMLPDLDGVQLLRRLKDIDPSPEVIVISGQGTIARAVEAGQAGAFFFLEKPVSQDGLMNILGRAIDRTQERAEHQQLKDQIRGRYSFANIVGQSKKMKELFELVESVAASDANILIQGENGTGKELIANAIHYNSNRVKGPFIKINCAAIPKDLIESELFGYKKGAFTGANTDKVGLFEMAEGGSLLLDEIGEMPVATQAKLLRVLEDRKLRRLGSRVETSVDVRVLAATNKVPEEAVARGELRNDLYYRLNVFNIHMPSLREHREDIPDLVHALLAEMSAKHGRRIATVSEAVLNAFKNYTWPGNVRELRNTLERAVIVCEGPVVETKHLPPGFGSAPTRPSLDEIETEARPERSM